jgi:hypothetical protein
MKKLILFSTLAVLAIAGCKKKPDGIVGTWKVTAATCNPAVQINGNSTTDLYSFIYNDACEQDNLLIFKEGTQLIEDQGVLKCDTADAQQSAATYTLNGSDLTIINSSNDTINFINVTVDEEHLKISQPTTISGTSTVATLILARQ